MNVGFEAADFERAVAHVSAERSPRTLVERLGLDWDHLGWLALDASASVLGETQERRGAVVAYGGEAFTAGFLIGVHLDAREQPRVPEGRVGLGRAVDTVQERGRHAVIADRCDLASVARIETIYSAALVESMELPAAEREQLRTPVTRIFENGLAVGLALGTGEESADNG